MQKFQQNEYEVFKESLKRKGVGIRIEGLSLHQLIIVCCRMEHHTDDDFFEEEEGVFAEGRVPVDAIQVGIPKIVHENPACPSPVPSSLVASPGFASPEPGAHVPIYNDQVAFLRASYGFFHLAALCVWGTGSSALGIFGGSRALFFLRHLLRRFFSFLQSM